MKKIIFLIFSIIYILSINLPAISSDYNLTKKVYGFHPGWLSDNEVKNYDWSAIHTLIYFGYEVDCNSGLPSTLYNWRTSRVIDSAKANGAKVQLLVALFGQSSIETLLSDTVKCDTLINNVIRELKYRNADGVNIDFESLPASQKANFVSFLSKLKTKLLIVLPHAELTIDGPPVDWSNSWDFAKINNIVDFIILMGYDYYWSGSENAGAVAPMGDTYWNVKSSVDYYLENGVNRIKLVLGVPWYGYNWQVESIVRGAKTLSKGTANRYSTCKLLAEKYACIYDEQTNSVYITYQDTTGYRQLWYDDSLTLAYKYQYVIEKAISGVAIWALGYQGDTPEMWQCLKTAFSTSDVENYSQDNLAVSIYPNPANYALNIKTKKEIISEIKIYNTLGEIVISSILSNDSYFMNLVSLNEGIYQVIITTENNQYYKSLLIKR